jgi:hypothetical protein
MSWSDPRPIVAARAGSRVAPALAEHGGEEPSVKKWAAIVVVLGVLAGARTARADDNNIGPIWVGIGIGAAVGVLVQGASVATIVGTSISLERGAMTRDWGLASLITGGIDVLCGSLVLGIGGPNPIQTGIGTPFILLGAVNVALGSTALAKSMERKKLRLGAVPIAGLDSTGHQMGGAALRFSW